MFCQSFMYEFVNTMICWFGTIEIQMKYANGNEGVDEGAIKSEVLLYV